MKYIIPILVLVLLSASVFGASVQRSFSKTQVAPGDPITVTLTVLSPPADFFALAKETLPAGWTCNSPHCDKHAFMGDTTWSYTITAPSTARTSTFTGTYQFTGDATASTTTCANNNCNVEVKTLSCLTSCPSEYNCGTISDNCDGSLTCGTCSSGSGCVNNKCVANPPSCAPKGASCATAECCSGYNCDKTGEYGTGQNICVDPTKPPVPPIESCTTDSNCDSGYKCVDGQCKKSSGPISLDFNACVFNYAEDGQPEKCIRTWHLMVAGGVLLLLLLLKK